MNGFQSPETKTVKDISKSTTSLCRLLDEGDQLLRLFWPVAISPSHQLLRDDDNWARSCSSSSAGGRCSPLVMPAHIKRQGSDAEYSVASEVRTVPRCRRDSTVIGVVIRPTV